MRKTISMIMIFVFGASLWPQIKMSRRNKGENQRPLIFRDNTDSNLEMNLHCGYARFMG